MSSLPEIIERQITQHGPMTVQDYWTLCLAHPEHGYYIKQNPLGRGGDFTTAPEISQMFGELIGIWAGDLWLKMNSPQRFNLVECGAGRGTMMADLLRATRAVPDFHAALSIHIVETSPHLRQVQKATISGYQVTWHDSLETLPADGPVAILGNEFLDALPIRQMVRTGDGWAERLIGLQDGKLAFGLGAKISMSDTFVAPQGKIFEFSPARDVVWQQICQRVKNQTGAALIIDYGHTQTALGDTFQAVRNHQYCGVLEDPGNADLTSHVDFARLVMLAQGLRPLVTTQGDFLRHMGIAMRADALLMAATPQQAEDIQAALRRLTDSDAMGTLFKVLTISSPLTLEPAGF